MLRLFLIDGSSQMYRAYHAPVRTAEGGFLRNAQGRPTNAVYIFVTMLRKLLNEQRPEYIAASFDLPGRTFRDDLVADYKANRAPMPDELAEQIPMVHAACEALGVPILTSERYEADDVIGTLTEKAAAAGFEVVIVTGDKDFFQLVRDGIKVYNPKEEGTWYDAAGVKEKFGVEPGQVVDVLALMGDTIDNIKGVPGIGDKGARELIAQYGTLENLLTHAGEVKNKRYREGLQGHADEARQSQVLARIHTDVPVTFAPDALRYRGATRERCFQIFNELGFRAFVGEYAPTADTIAKSYRLATTEDEVRALADRLRRAGGFAMRLLPDDPSSMRAAIVGLTFATAARDADYVPTGHRGLTAVPSLGIAAALDILKPVLEDRAILKCGHDLKFDAIMLARHGVTLQGLDTDTMLTSYLIDSTRAEHLIEDLALEHVSYKALKEEDVCGRGAKAISLADVPADILLTYAGERADLIVQLAPVFRGLLEREQLTRVYEELERPLIPVLVDVEQAGIRIDGPALASQSQRLEQDIARRSKDIFVAAGGEFNINSPKQLAEVLFDKMQLPVLKRTGASKAPSTAVEVLEELALAHDLPRLILEWRSLMKLKGTYIDALPQLVNPRTGRVHTCFNQAVAATGRLSSSDPNLQNIPIKTELGREIRGAFIADRGNVLVSADYSQIEFRVLAHMSEDPVLVAAFSEGADFHERTGAQDLRRRLREGPAPAAQHRQDGELCAALRKVGVHVVEGHRRDDGRGAEIHRLVLRRLPQRARVYRSHARRRPCQRRRQDDVRAPAPRTGTDQPQLPGPVRGRADGGEHADSGFRRRHPQEGDDRRPRRPAESRRWPRPHDPHCARRAAFRDPCGGRRRNRGRGARVDGSRGQAQRAADCRRRRR